MKEIFTRKIGRGDNKMVKLKVGRYNSFDISIVSVLLLFKSKIGFSLKFSISKTI